MNTMIKQDLHVHTVYSSGDSSVEEKQTVEYIAALDHAEIRGISDHYEYLRGDIFEEYRKKLYQYGFYCGCEVNDSQDALEAVSYPYDYYIYHCRDKASEYEGAETLLETGKPVIVSHPIAIGADLNKVPTGCILEINNRYIWQADDYMGFFKDHLKRFRFVIGSDAHKPNWLNQVCARHAAAQLGISEYLVFPGRRQPTVKSD
jgi:histidinol phosphatase-like PHP family hydrolase